jgi:hypothetical protein
VIDVRLGLGLDIGAKVSHACHRFPPDIERAETLLRFRPPTFRGWTTFRSWKNRLGVAHLLISNPIDRSLDHPTQMDSEANNFSGGLHSYPNNDSLAFECGHSGVEDEAASGLGRNPFVATTRPERDENFPNFEQAMLLDQSGSSVLSCGNSVVLSISARAALNEHNRYIARYGIDDSFQAHGSPPQHVETESTTPLDLEWERLLLNTSNVNLSGLSSLPSTHSASNNMETDIRITSNVDQLDNTVLSHGAEGIEVVRSDLSVSDYFDTSRISELRTPDRLHNVDMPGTGVTVRGEQNDDPFDNDGSRISDSSSNVSLKRMQRLFFSAGLPMPDASSSPTSSRHTAENSLLLTNADLSRISADGSDFNVDVSVTYNPGSNNSVRGDQLSEDTGQSKSHHVTEMDGQQQQRRLRPPFMNVSPQSSPYRGPQLSPRRRPLHKPSRPMEPSQHKAFSPARPVKRPTGASFSASQQTHPQTPTRSSPNNSLCSMPYIQDPELAILELSPISKTRPPPRSSQQQPTTVHHATEEDDDSRLDMLGLSPISRQAADVAVQIINDHVDWRTKPIQSGQQAVDTNSSGESLEASPDRLVFGAILDDEHCSFEPSSSSEGNQAHPTVVAYKSDSLNDECRDDVSPLHSSSEQKKDSSHDTSNAANSDLKKSSLSSITPNSSSEHHVASLQESASARPSQSNSTLAQTMSDKQNSRSISVAMAASPPWSADDRRHYRTVVPVRVFFTEPNDFPNEDDSFSDHFRRRLPPTLVGASQKLGPTRADCDSRSVPCIPVVSFSPEGQRQWIGERSFMSSPQ